MSDNVVISLPNNEERIVQLWRKLDEYRARLTDQKFSPHKFDTTCKILVLETLLNEGEVDLDNARDRIREEHGDEYLPNLSTAFAVMYDYVATGGKEVCGGTGLK